MPKGQCHCGAIRYSLDSELKHSSVCHCIVCGTSLFYFNEAMMPGVVDILTATLDDPENYPPQLHVQMGDALPWEATLDELPRFERYPG
jgi:hypothetical protein